MRKLLGRDGDKELRPLLGGWNGLEFGDGPIRSGRSGIKKAMADKEKRFGGGAIDPDIAEPIDTEYPWVRQAD